MARAAWSGAINFAGFPVNVRLYSRVKSRSGESFKQLAPTNQAPVQQQLVDTDGSVVERADCLKGVEVGKGQFKALPPEAVEMIASAERSVTVEPESFCPVESVPLALSTRGYAVVPDEKVPGADQPTGIIWNGLRASRRAYITEITVRAGSRDAILAIWADDDGLYANELPYVDELNDVPAWEPKEDERAAETFAAFVDSQYADIAGPFDHSAFESKYRQRRADAVQAALKGEAIEVPEAAQAKTAAPDLMAAMQASLGKPKPKPKAKAKEAKKAKT